MKKILATLLLFVLWQGNAQTPDDITIRSLSVSFDSTVNNSPIYVLGSLKNIDEIKGLKITIATSQGNTPLVSDTIFILGSSGSYYTSWNKTIKPSMGRTISTQKMLPTNVTGHLNCNVTVLYKNGTVGLTRLYAIKRKS